MSAVDVANPNYARDLEGLVLAMPLVRFYGIQFVTIEPGRPGCSVATLLPAGWGNATVDYSVKLLKPANGATLAAVGTVLSAGRTLSVGEARVFSVERGVRTLCAAGIATVRNFAATSD